jgi:response regulator RpfG family c-di-GMP phosphodiesterase
MTDACPDPAPCATPAIPPTLLLVDDEPSVLSALRRLFRLQGYDIEQATSGADALQVLARRPVDLVISDMRMPEMDGATFLEAVRQSHPDTVRLLLTGYADIGATVAAINRGEIHRYIAKPWDDQDLLLVVADALRRRALEQHNRALLALTRQQNLDLAALNHGLEDRVAARTAELEQLASMLQAAYDELDADFTKAMKVFSGLLELRHDGMAGHGRRVSALVERVARRLALDERSRHDLVLAALLHDIGKIGFSDELLRQPVSRLNAQELARYQRHPVDGEAALLSMDKLRGAALIVRQHHERVDGRGFPDQLGGDDIGLGARILAAASDYDGLVSGDLAETAYTAEQARQALYDGIGSHYDPAVVAALCSVLDQLADEAVAELKLDERALRPRMVLSQDLLTPMGAVLLPSGYRFDAAMVRRVTDLAERFGLHFQIRVLASSVEGMHLWQPPGAHHDAATHRT